MICPKLFIFSLWCPLSLAKWIWNPHCLYSDCWGDPIQGDGSTSFDTWSGSKKYSTIVYYTCKEGVGFDLYDNNYDAPAKIYVQCGRQCEEGTYGQNHIKAGQGTGWCKYNQGHCNPQWLYSFTPLWDWGEHTLPECSVGEQILQNEEYDAFFVAACDKEKLPSVSYSSNEYSNDALVPGETATIKCNSGYEFKGDLVATSTEKPELPPGERVPIECKISY